MIAGRQLQHAVIKDGKPDMMVLFYLDYRSLASEPSNTTQIDCYFSARI